MKFEGSCTNNNSSSNNTNSANTDNDIDQDLRIKYNKNSSFSLKALLEKTKSNNCTKVLHCSNCDSTNCQHIRITRTNRLKMLNHQHHKINIVKPIALRPNQEQIKQSSTYCLNDLNNKFSSIDTINSGNSNSNNKLSSMQRRNTIPRVNFKNITLSNYVINSSVSNSHQQRPQLNFIKMKLQRYLNENCCSGEVVNSDLFKLKTFDILSLSTLNLNAKHESLYYQTGQSLSASSLSSNQNMFQMLSSSSSNESDLDIAQIENDLF